MSNKNQNLTNLIIDAQNDVDGAFDKLYHESFRHAYCTASLLLKKEQDIEDVLQNSYMYVAKYIKDLKNPESFNNWLSVIVKHECQKYIAKQKRISDIFTSAKKIKETELTNEFDLHTASIEKSEIRDAIQRIVDNLPADKRACVILFYYEQHSLTEISEILGVPEGTVLSRLFYARKKLEKEFKKLQKNDESLFGISVIPLIVSLFAYQTKTLIIPSTAESGIIAAITAESAVVLSTATIGVSATATTASVTTASAATTVSTAAGTAGTAVATKVAAVAVAASVAVGGGVATVNHIKTNSVANTSLSEEHATVTARLTETTLSVTENTSITSALSEPSSSCVEETKAFQAESSTKKSSTRYSTVRSSIIDFLMTSTTTTTETTTQKVTTTTETTTQENTTTRKETTTETTIEETTVEQEETTVEQGETTSEPETTATDIFNVSDGVLIEYSGDESEIQVPSTVTAIGIGAFAGNTDITSVSMPSTVTRIGMEAFSDCTNLVNIELSSSLSSIGVAAFYGCSSLTTVTIPDGTQSISDEAFSYCTSLTSITIPDSVTNISEDAFYGSDNVVIRCSEGSAAYNYAVENSINYELI